MNGDKEDMVRLRDERDEGDCIKVDLKNKCIIRLGEKMVCHKTGRIPARFSVRSAASTMKAWSFTAGRRKTSDTRQR